MARVLASERTLSAADMLLWRMDSLALRSEERDSRCEISAFRFARVLERAVCWAVRAGRVEVLEVWAVAARVVRVLERCERRASFWGFGGMGGAAPVDCVVVVGKGASKGEVRRSVGEGFFG